MSDAKHGRYVTKQVNLAAGKPHVQILFQKVKYWTPYFLQQPNFLLAKFADLWVVKRTIIARQLVLQQHVFVARFTVPLRFMKLKTFLKAVNWNLNSHEAIKKLQAKPIGIHLANSIQEDAGSSNIRLVRVLILLRLFWWIMLIVVSIKGAVYYCCKCYDCLPVCRLRSCGGNPRTQGAGTNVKWDLHIIWCAPRGGSRIKALELPYQHKSFAHRWVAVKRSKPMMRMRKRLLCIKLGFLQKILSMEMGFKPRKWDLKENCAWKWNWLPIPSFRWTPLKGVLLSMPPTGVVPHIPFARESDTPLSQSKSDWETSS